MALNEKKRQQKLAKKKNRRKELAKVARQKMSAGYSLLTDTKRLARIAAAPIHECLMPRELFQLGMGNLMVTRKLESGNLAIGVFLLDTFCLGVKDAFLRIITPFEYDQYVDGMRQHETPQRIEPAYARKLIEDCAAYARAVGLAPHPDYAAAQLILGDIDPAECTDEFVFGKDGKPFYVNGPNDTPARQKQIIQTLTQHCGPGGYDYLMMLDPFGGASLPPGVELIEEGDWEGEEEEGEDEEERDVD